MIPGLDVLDIDRFKEFNSDGVEAARATVFMRALEAHIYGHGSAYHSAVMNTPFFCLTLTLTWPLPLSRYSEPLLRRN